MERIKARKERDAREKEIATKQVIYYEDDQDQSGNAAELDKPPEQYLASYAHWEGEHVSACIKSTAAGRPLPRTYKPAPRLAAVSLGPSDGFLAYDDWTVVWGRLVPFIKFMIKFMIKRFWLPTMFVMGWLPRLSKRSPMPSLTKRRIQLQPCQGRQLGLQ